jgi:TolA-binding protein
MKTDGFQHVLGQETTPADVQYPCLKRDWFERTVLPFLDKVSMTVPAIAANQSAVQAGHAIATQASGAATTRPSMVRASSPEAQHLLAMAKLGIQNNRVALARDKLQLILSAYPTDPCAAEARKLLATLPPP